jgi:4'-phosphopantetheinyl transferase
MRREDVQHLWSLPGGTPELCAREVHVWSASLDLDAFELEQMRAVLSRDELLRSERSPLIAERNRFAAGRGLLRQVLSQYIATDPADIQFAYGQAGKPYLIENPHDIRFNISHSGDVALIALAQGREVGVDIETICDMSEMEDIAARFFSDDARTEYASAECSNRRQVFFKCWTEKEAVSKCTGQGIADEQPLIVDDITIIPLAPALGYAASLAISGPALKLRTWRWPQPTATMESHREVTTLTGAFL